MYREVAEAWVSALRSGEYKQGKGALSRDGKYCCLGVLCEIAVNNGLDVEVESDDGYTYYDGNRAFLPGRVVKWSGMNNEFATAMVGVDRLDLVDMNDASESFETIADVIENHYEAF